MYLRRTNSHENKIQSLIKNLKLLFSNTSIDIVPNLYFTNKIEEQRTLHLKFMKLLSNNNSLALKKQYQTNSVYNLMIKDLINNFGNLEIGEINDFLTWYRWSLSCGCIGVIPETEHNAIKQHIQVFPISSNHLQSIKSTFLFNLASLGLENKSIMNSLLNSSKNFQMPEIKKIFHSMSLNSEYNNPNLFELISQNFNQKLTLKFSVSEYLENFDFYCLYCDLNQIQPNESIKENFFNQVSESIKKAPWKLSEVTKYKGKLYLDEHLNRYYLQYVEYFKRNLNSPAACFNLFNFVVGGVGVSNEWLKNYYERLRFHIKDNSDDYIAYKSKLLMHLSQFKGLDLNLSDLCIQSIRPLNEFPVIFIRNWVYYHELTGKSMVDALNLNIGLDGIEKLCKDLDFIHLSSLLSNLLTYPCMTHNSELVKNWIMTEIVDRCKSDEALASNYFVLVSMTNKFYPHKVYRELLKSIEKHIKDTEFVFKISNYPKILKNS